MYYVPGAQTPSANKIETKMLKWMVDVIMIEFENYSDTRTERENPQLKYRYLSVILVIVWGGRVLVQREDVGVWLFFCFISCP